MSVKLDAASNLVGADVDLKRNSYGLALQAGVDVPLGGGVLSLALAVAGFVGLADSTSARPRMAAAEIVATLRRRRQLAIPLAFSFADRLTVGFIVSTLSLYLGLVPVGGTTNFRSAADIASAAALATAA